MAIQIIEENRDPTFLEQLGGGVEGFMEAYGQAQERRKQENQQRSMAKLLGLDEEEFGGLPMDAQLKGAEFQQKERMGGIKGDQSKQVEEMNSLMGALDTVNRMKQIRGEGRLGLASPVTQYIPGFGSKVREDRGEYSQLGKSLIQYATNIPIRNRVEFETLAEKLYDPNISDSEAKGVLDGIERIIKNSLSKYGDILPFGKKIMDQGNLEQDIEKKQERKPLTEFLG